MVVFEADLDDSHQSREHHGHLHPPGITSLHVQVDRHVGSVGRLHVKHGVWGLPHYNTPDHQTYHCKGACRSHTQTEQSSIKNCITVEVLVGMVLYSIMSSVTVYIMQYPFEKAMLPGT